ncbi:MAG: choice-of-anchor J domain-containing protein [Bacteroidetes bacterium]|nr:choice-of-anchor J domain-containing protein [Bacteroidota bacterium]
MKIQKCPTMFYVTILLLGNLWISCNKKFDEPPSFIAPDIISNYTIAELKNLHTNGMVELVNEDKVIRGIVVADDRSGNFYKSIVIEDSTGGISLSLDRYDLYTDYPIGREIFIKIKGLYLGDYNKLIQLGGGIDNTGTAPALAPLAATLFDQYIIRGSYSNEVLPLVVSISDLNDSYQNRLIQIKNCQFATSDTSKTFAIAGQSSPSAVNYTLSTCDGSKIILRNSNYADFASMNLPNGNGDISAIYTVYGTTKQLYIRDTADTPFYGLRCDGTNGNILFSQDFTDAPIGSNINLPGWLNVAETGSVKYTCANYQSNSYAKISAYLSGYDVIKTWMVTPLIDLGNYTQKIFSFTNADGYDNGATLKVYLSTDYKGDGKPWDYTWSLLPATISHGHTSSYGSFISSGDMDISAYSKIYIAFVYEGADGAGIKRTTTFQIDDIKITGN